MPTPRKPTNLKIIDGSRQPDIPAVDLPLVDYVPAAPDWLPNAHAIREWDRLAPILFNNKLLTEAGVTTLGILCSLFGKIVQLYAAGESPTGHMIAQYRALANDFGLTPVAQGKVRAGSADDKSGNRFTKIGKKA